MTKRGVCIILILEMVLCLFSGCGKRKEIVKNNTETEISNEFQDKTVAICIYNFEDDFMTLYREELERCFVSAGFLKENIIVVDAKGKQATQTKQIQKFIGQKVDLLVVNPVKTSSAETITDLVVEANIPLIYVNREPDLSEEQRWRDNDWKITFVGCNAQQSGTYQGEMIADLGLNAVDISGDGKIQYVMVEGDKENSDSKYRTEYSVKALLDASMEVECLEDKVGNFMRDEAKQIVKEAIEKHGREIEVIFCNNDAMAMGALEIIKDSGLVVGTDIFLVGVDALPEAVNCVLDGTMTGTVFNNHYEQCRSVVNAAMDYIKGEKVENYIGCDYVKVTTKNAEKVLSIINNN